MVKFRICVRVCCGCGLNVIIVSGGNLLVDFIFVAAVGVAHYELANESVRNSCEPSSISVSAM